MLEEGLDEESFASFLQTLQRFVRERLVPSEPEVIRANRIPEGLLTEMRDLGLFGLTIPPKFGGAGLSLSQYLEVIL